MAEQERDRASLLSLVRVGVEASIVEQTPRDLLESDAAYGIASTPSQLTGLWLPNVDSDTNFTDGEATSNIDPTPAGLSFLNKISMKGIYLVWCHGTIQLDNGDTTILTMRSSPSKAQVSSVITSYVDGQYRPFFLFMILDLTLGTMVPNYQRLYLDGDNTGVDDLTMGAWRIR